MLQTLTIERFRGISALHLEDLGKVNIFVGTNAAGKTTVLEALSMIAHPVGAGWLVTLSTWRDMPTPTLASDDALRVYFYDLKVSEPAKLDFTLDGRCYKLVIEALTGTSGASISTDASSSSASPMEGEPQTDLRGVKLIYHQPGKKAVESILNLMPPPPGIPQVGAFLNLTGATFQTPPPPATVSQLGAFHIHARRATSLGESAQLLTSLYENKRDREFLDLLRKVDPRIERIFPGVTKSGATILVDVGHPRALPINVLGDGFCRVALMATGLLHGKGKLLIVDEIDSGLHYSIMRSVWEGIAGISADIQVFCATHNEEMLRATLAAFENHPDWLRVFRLDRHDDGGVTAQKYTYETFNISEKAGLEIR